MLLHPFSSLHICKLLFQNSLPQGVGGWEKPCHMCMRYQAEEEMQEQMSQAASTVSKAMPSHSELESAPGTAPIRHFFLSFSVILEISTRTTSERADSTGQ